MAGRALMIGGRAIMRGGRALMATSGSPCCCGECPYVYLAELCNPVCIEEYKFRHICGTSLCPPEPPALPGSFAGPIVAGTVIKEDIRCYRIPDLTRYCPPGQTCEHYPPLPVQTTELTTLNSYGCFKACAPEICPPLEGWYKLTACSCGTTLPFDYYVCCEEYEAALSLGNCPVWVVALGYCARVLPGTVPVPEIPVGGHPVCREPDYLSCRTCCCNEAKLPPGCCLCTSGTQTISYGGCTQTVETGPPGCAWSSETGGFQGCIYRKQTAPDGCVFTFWCATISGTTVNVKYWDGGQCTGPLVQVSCACGSAQMNSDGLNFSEESYQINPCDMPSAGMPSIFSPGFLGSPPCCATGSRVSACDFFSIDFKLLNPAPCTNAKVEVFGNVVRTSPPGTCGNDCGPLGLVLLDGSPASTIGKVQKAGGCAGCGEKGAI